MRANVPILGFIIGVFTPVLGFLIVFLIFRQGQPLSAFLQGLSYNHQTLAKIMTLSLLGNLIPFLICTNKRLDYTARGIMIATMLYAVLVVLIKFVW